jgi:hypothetical protein
VIGVAGTLLIALHAQNTLNLLLGRGSAIEIDQGELALPRSGYNEPWLLNNAYREDERHQAKKYVLPVLFNHGFAEPPTVILSIEAIDMPASHVERIVGVFAGNITVVGFEFNLTVSSNESQVNRLKVLWLAINSQVTE